MKKEITETVGDGITERKRKKASFQVPLTEADMAELCHAQDRYNEIVNRPWRFDADIIKAVRRDLAAAKLASPDNSGGTNDAFIERVSVPWYLGEIDFEARVVELAIANGNPWEAVTSAIRIGDLLAELRIKELWGKDAIRGRKSVTDGKKGGDDQGRLADVRARHQQLREAYNARLERGIDEPVARRHAANEIGYSYRNASRILHPQK